MASSDAAAGMFSQADTNRDGRIDKNEFRNWISNTEGLTPSSYESSTGRFNQNDNTTGRIDRYKSKVSSQNEWESTADKYTSYGSTRVASESSNEAVIHTRSLEETNRYLERSANNIYIDPNPKIIRRTTTEAPVTYEQRVLIRYLQPPTVPPPGPLIIKEVRPPQPPPPPPLVIRQHASSLAQPPPLILRERPPAPPVSTQSETITRMLPPIPAPPRSVVIERFPALPEKPRDIIIERWIPYGSQTERRKVVERAPPAVQYPQPTHTVVVYEAVQQRINRKFEKLGVTKENPDDYVARYGASLLDSATLVQQARNAGVIEDISPPVSSTLTYTNTREYTTDFDQSNEITNQGYSLSGGSCSEKIQLDAGQETVYRGSRNYSSSPSNIIGDSAGGGSASIIRGEYRVDDTDLVTTDISRAGKLN
ncbi:unnamed protein product [Rotaria sp. Silwood2]|nr:unnamed protein product [Rotaria sp. Silwood2]CAF3109097.1 unnamed protein product [Rotaria sp. Silwood2]CAF3949861.1 unnamed protein product [Rotaria sp. Silwood2]CAF4338153.1 unnamed protein product [Rotaria sp. Silwood2]